MPPDSIWQWQKKPFPRETGNVSVFESNWVKLLKTTIAKIHDLINVVWNCIVNS